jgi:hypothetical protein
LVEYGKEENIVYFKPGQEIKAFETLLVEAGKHYDFNYIEVNRDAENGEAPVTTFWHVPWYQGTLNPIFSS